MRFAAILNRDGGTLRTLDLDAFAGRVRETLEAAGHSVEIDVVAGRDIAAALEKAIAKRNVDVVLSGGGDGTISTAASLLMNKKKALAILPAGTMNLFARGLGIPQTLEAALQSFADGDVIAVDVPPGTEFNADGEVRDAGLERVTVERDAYSLVSGA